MTNAKRNTKSIIALVVMSLLLVASIVLAATGAWFTDKIDQQTGSLSFGKIDIDAKNFAVAASNTIDTDNTKLMPGSAINFEGTITNVKDDAYIAMKVVITFAVDVDIKNPGEGWTYDATAKTLTYETKATKIAAQTGSIELATVLAGIKVPTAVGNTAAETDVTVTADAVAIQQANTDGVVEEGVTTYSALLALV